jgi:hypothetical protein
MQKFSKIFQFLKETDHLLEDLGTFYLAKMKSSKWNHYLADTQQTCYSTIIETSSLDF